MKMNASKILAIFIVLGVAWIFCNPWVWMTCLGFFIEAAIFLAVVNLVSRLIFGRSFKQLLYGKDKK